MVEDKSLGRIIFHIFNYTFLIFLGLLCVFPIIHVLAISFSSKAAATAGLVGLWPVEFTTASYEFVLQKPEFLGSFWVSIKRLFLGVFVNIFLAVLTAYPLSKEANDFKMRIFYVWFFVFTMLFNGGLIPQYMVVMETGLMDSIWALILPMGVNVFLVILLLNFFRGLPKELEEAAFIDGASHWVLLWKIYFPLSMPSIATITLFAAVFHWNEWFHGLIFMNSPENYPLQSYLQTILVDIDLEFTSSTDMDKLALISDRTNKAAQIFLGSLPILLVYPFLQKYFVKGIVLGSVKE